MEKIKEIIKKLCTREVILYIVFGLLTSAVNLVSFFVLANIVKLEENISNIIAIILCVLFAYFTNRKLVFNSSAETMKERFIEFIKFMSGRAVTMVIEWGGCFILFLMPIPNMVSKLIMTAIVIILNFFISKFFAFKK